MNGKIILALSLLLLLVCVLDWGINEVGVEASDAHPVHNIDTGLNYTSIQSAISAPETSSGHTVRVEAGTYREEILVDKSLAIIGEGRNVTVIEGGGGIVVHVTANDVLVSGFAVKNGFVGIYLDHSKNSTVLKNTVTNVTSYYAVYASYSDDLTIDQNIVGPNSASGILVTNSLDFRVSQNTVHNNAHYGINANASSNGMFVQNDASENYYDGIGLAKGCRNVTIAGNNVANNVLNGISMIDPDCEDNLVYDNNIINNVGKQASAFSANRWDNGIEGNYWSDYTGVDKDHNGIGDTSLVISENNTDNFPLMGMLSVFKTNIGPDIGVVSNSSIVDFAYFDSNSTIRLKVLNRTPTQTFGFCRVLIPHDVMTEPYNVTVNGANPFFWNQTLYDDGNNRWIYLAYQHSEVEVLIQGSPPPDRKPPIESFPYWIPVTIVASAAILAVLLVYFRRSRKRCKNP